MKKIKISHLIGDLHHDLCFRQRRGLEFIRDIADDIVDGIRFGISVFKKCPACQKRSMQLNSCSKCSYETYFSSQMSKKDGGLVFEAPEKSESYKGFLLIKGKIYRNGQFIIDAPENPFKYIEKLSLL